MRDIKGAMGAALPEGCCNGCCKHHAMIIAFDKGHLVGLDDAMLR
jgi:hypothetical protein